MKAFEAGEALAYSSFLAGLSCLPAEVWVRGYAEPVVSVVARAMVSIVRSHSVQLFALATSTVEV